MRIMCVANQKGGVGKTTVTVGLAAAVAQAGGSALVIDADPQGHATLALGRPQLYDADLHPNLAEALTDDRAGHLYDIASLADFGAWEDPAGLGRIDLVPSCDDMFIVDQRLVATRGREQRLARLLANSGLEDIYDTVLIDCPPALGILTDNALLAARSVLIVAGAEPSSRHGLGLLTDQIRGLRTALGVDVQVEGLVVNRLEHTRVAADTVASFTELGLPIVASIPKRTRLQEAWAAGVPVQALDPTGELATIFTGLAEALGLVEAIVHVTGDRL